MSEDLNLKNEAELQSHIEARLRAALPFLPVQIQFERHLHLHLGHHKIVIDGMSRGRCPSSGSTRSSTRRALPPCSRRK